jgi:hypothetical protein
MIVTKLRNIFDNYIISVAIGGIRLKTKGLFIPTNTHSNDDDDDDDDNNDNNNNNNSISNKNESDSH